MGKGTCVLVEIEYDELSIDVIFSWDNVVELCTVQGEDNDDTCMDSAEIGNLFVSFKKI